MDIKISMIDYTINEIMRLGVTASSDIKAMLSVLNKYALEFADISLDNYEKNKTHISEEDLHEFRCVTACNIQEINRAKEAGFSKIRINVSADSAGSVLTSLNAVLQKVYDKGLDLYLSIDNILEFPAEEAEKVYPLVLKYKLKRLVLGDMKASLEPFTTYDRLLVLKKKAVCPLEYMACNDYGLATANTLSAIRAGISFVAAAVGGIGCPRMAAMEEVLMSVRHLWKEDRVPEGRSMAADCAGILDKAGIILPGEKAVIGKCVFAHESGIHVDGIVKNPELYEVIKPEEVGLSRILVIGKYSGTASLIQKFRQFHMELSQENARILLDAVRDTANSQKGPLTDVQLKTLYVSQMKDLI